MGASAPIVEVAPPEPVVLQDLGQTPAKDRPKIEKILKTIHRERKNVYWELIYGQWIVFYCKNTPPTFGEVYNEPHNAPDVMVDAEFCRLEVAPP